MTHPFDMHAFVGTLGGLLWLAAVGGMLWITWPTWRLIRNRPAITISRGRSKQLVSPLSVFIPIGMSLAPLMGFLIPSLVQRRVMWPGVDMILFYFVWLALLVVGQFSLCNQIQRSISQEREERARGWLSRDEGI